MEPMVAPAASVMCSVTCSVTSSMLVANSRSAVIAASLVRRAAEHLGR